MATIAYDAAPVRDDRRFFLISAIVMTVVLFGGFITQLAMGRSTFASPPLLHAHAMVFMGWVVINLLQNIFAATDRMALHRRLGWIGAGWIALMLIFGIAVTVAIVRRGEAPFIFQPLHILLFNPLSLMSFIGLTIAAIRLRRRSDWHRRLHFCAMTMLLGPGIGRLLPMPLLIPWAYEATLAVALLFPIAGIIADVRRDGAAHPAWRWGIGTIIATFAVTQALTYSAAGIAIYEVVTRGSPGASVAPLEFPAPPGVPRPTGLR